MKQNKHYLLLMIILTIIVFVVTAITVSNLYRVAFEQQREHLIAMTQSQASLVETVARFDEKYSREDVEGGAVAATLGQVRDAHINNKGFGKSGEFVFAKKENNKIVFLLPRRFKNVEDITGQDKLLEVGGSYAEPIQLALDGKSGTVIAQDYRGELVLAAYEPVEVLNYGVVTKIDIKEIRAPFIRVGLISVIIAIVLIFIGAFLFFRVTQPIIKGLQDSEKYNRMLFESSPIGLALSSLDGSLIDTNSAYGNITGHSQEEVKQLSYWDITPREYADDEQRQLESLNTSGRYGPYEKEYIHKDGRRIPVRLLGQIIERDGKEYIWSSVEDISERIETEVAVKQSEARLNEAQRLAKVGSWELDLLTNELIWSDEIFRIFEIDKLKFDATYEAFLNAIHPDDRDKVNEAYSNSLLDRKPYEITHRLQMSDGEIKYVHETCESFFDDEHNPVRSVGTVQDITEIKLAEAELDKYRTHLEELIEERTKELRETQDELVRKERLATLGQLTATVSHELRNPLGAIRPSLYVVQKKSDQQDEQVQNAIARIDRSIDRCDRIIDELLDFTRITELKMKQVLLDDWLENVIAEQVIPEGIILEKQFNLNDVELSVDTDRLRRAFINVLENGCHSMMDDNQQVVKDIDAHLIIKTKSNDVRIEIIITDTGCGITKETLAKIYEPLYSTKGFGVGLGMPTVKQIMEQHGGGVEINSEKDKGTSATLWLPISLKSKNG